MEEMHSLSESIKFTQLHPVSSDIICTHTCGMGQ